MEKIKADLQKAKEIDMDKMRKELSKVGPEVEKAMKDARVSLDKARQEVTAYKNLVSALDKDGLLNKNGNYTIEYKNKVLTVNGKALSAEATSKYSEYLNGKDHFTLQKDNDGLDIKNN
jgi:hypothetical protein